VNLPITDCHGRSVQMQVEPGAGDQGTTAQEAPPIAQGRSDLADVLLWAFWAAALTAVFGGALNLLERWL
jgi:hypothetical protein